MLRQSRLLSGQPDNFTIYIPPLLKKAFEFYFPFDLPGSITTRLSLGNTAGKNDDACKKQKRCLQQSGSHSVVLNSDLMQVRICCFQSGGGLRGGLICQCYCIS